MQYLAIFFPALVIWLTFGWIAGLAATIATAIGTFALLNAGWLD